MKTEIVPIIELTEYEHNPRSITDDQFQQLCENLLYYGFLDPLVANQDNVVLGGNQRLRAANYLISQGYKDFETVPVYYIHVDDPQGMAKVSLILNNHHGDYDWDKLTSVLTELEIDPIELGELGFDSEELEANIDITFDDPIENDNDADEIPEVDEKQVVVKLGEIWLLGNHRLLCGDCTEKTNVDRLMHGKKADMVFTDPPYNINFEPQRKTHGKIQYDNMTDEQFESFLSNTFTICKEILNNDTYLITFMGWSTIHNFRSSLQHLFLIKSMPVWVKNNFGIGYYTRPQYEAFYLCLNGDPQKPNTAPSDVFQFSKVNKTLHSCQKPIDLIENIINNFNKQGLIYDPFMGSGSTLIACEKTNRICYGMEIDEWYCTVILQRYLDYTGNQPIRESDGKTYEQIREELGYE